MGLLKVLININALSLFITLGICDESNRVDRTCRILTSQRYLNELRQPLLLKSNSEFFYPDIARAGLVEFKTTIHLVCPSGTLLVNSIQENVQSMFFECPEFRSYVSSSNEVSCTRDTIPIIRLKLSEPCPTSTCLEIGYQLNILDFLPIIEYIAIDVNTQQALVIHYKIVPIIAARQVDKRAWTFMNKGLLFKDIPINWSEIFHRDYQHWRFYEIFHDWQIAADYISEIGDYYLTQGQLFSERDLFYTNQQISAYFYENVVPIWRSISHGNWELVSHVVRELASDSKYGLSVWSGIIGILKLPDRFGIPKKIYLYEGRRGEQLIPVPKLLYKYIYDEHRHRGLVLLTINDPRLVQGFNTELILCRINRICWFLYPSFVNVEKGFTYCCNLNEFAHVARNLNLPVFHDTRSFN